MCSEPIPRYANMFDCCCPHSFQRGRNREVFVFMRGIDPTRPKKEPKTRNPTHLLTSTCRVHPKAISGISSSGRGKTKRKGKERKERKEKKEGRKKEKKKEKKKRRKKKGKKEKRKKGKKEKRKKRKEITHFPRKIIPLLHGSCSLGGLPASLLRRGQGQWAHGHRCQRTARARQPSSRGGRGVPVRGNRRYCRCSWS